MDSKKLANVLREHAEKLRSQINSENASDTCELIRVLARVVEGKQIERAFGAPGDWGYSTPIGAALARYEEPEID